MPVPYANGFILLQTRLDKQLAYNGNKPPGQKSPMVKPSKNFDWNKFRGGEQNSIALDFNEKSNLELIKKAIFGMFLS